MKHLRRIFAAVATLAGAVLALALSFHLGLGPVQRA